MLPSDYPLSNVPYDLGQRATQTLPPTKVIQEDFQQRTIT